MAALHVSILTPAKVVGVFSAEQAQVPGIDGYLGVLPGHTQLISELGDGELLIHTRQGIESYFVSGGYLDVGEGDHVTILVDVAEKPVDIKVDRAKDARQRALSRLADESGVDVVRAQAALGRAEQRLVVAARLTK